LPLEAERPALGVGVAEVFVDCGLAVRQTGSPCRGGQLLEPVGQAPALARRIPGQLRQPPQPVDIPWSGNYDAECHKHVRERAEYRKPQNVRDAGKQLEANYILAPRC
jgi:hypothetical protein